MLLYADAQYTEEGREEGRTLRKIKVHGSGVGQRQRVEHVLMLTVAWRGDTGAVLGSCITVHVVTVIVAIIPVRITMVGIRAPPGMRIRVMEVMKGESK
jgi:hypothetical protein